MLVGLPTALYYRDLFVHRLGATTADRGFLLLVDGQVMTAFGIFLQDFLQFRTRYLPEMFGITRSSSRYHCLGKRALQRVDMAGRGARPKARSHLQRHVQ